jgi:hypothetical protein
MHVDAVGIEGDETTGLVSLGGGSTLGDRAQHGQRIARWRLSHGR